MGRIVQSVGQPPAGFRRDARAKKAKATANQVIPTMLSAHPRARRGIEASELIIDPPPSVQPGSECGFDGSDEGIAGIPEAAGPRLTLRTADTLTVAQSLVLGASSVTNAKSSPPNKVAFLNMASPLSPGGGFFNGANSQEESLCMRTTLLPSLRDDYYRLPELGAVYTPDVLVFRDEAGEKVLGKKNRWFADCISAAMLRHPDTECDDVTGRGIYVQEKDRGLVLQKMRMVLRICQAKRIGKVVLGAWGCGAYGNPLGEIATAWRKVLIPKQKTRQKKQRNGVSRSCLETWHGIEEVVFAINDPAMAEAFATAFGEDLAWQTTVDSEQDGESDKGDGDDGSD